MNANQRTSSHLDQPRRVFSVLPVELLRIISDQLPPASQITLALSCKALYTCVFPLGKLPKLSEEEQARLLLWREKDTPGHFWCYICNRFCAFEPAKFFGRSPRQPHMCYFGIQSQDVSLREKLRLRSVFCLGLNFFDAHLIMNGHLYGKQHGLPISILPRNETHDVYVPPILRETWYLAPNMLPWPDWIQRPLHSTPTSPDYQFIPSQHWTTLRETTFQLTPQFQRDTGFDSPQSMVPWNLIRRVSSSIIDDELYLSTFHSISGPLGTERLLPAFLMRIHVTLCGHIACYWPVFNHHMHYPSAFRRYISSTRRAVTTSLCGRRRLLRPLRLVGCKVVSCGLCYSDGCFSLVRNSETKKWVMELTSYHRLGRCERPDEDAWKALLAKRGTMPRRQHENTPHGLYCAGAIRKRWNDSFGIPSEKRTAKWIGD